MLGKIIEMTLDGRLSLIWAFVLFCIFAWVFDVVVRRVCNRRVSVGRNMRKY